MVHFWYGKVDPQIKIFRKDKIVTKNNRLSSDTIRPNFKVSKCRKTCGYVSHKKSFEDIRRNTKTNEVWRIEKQMVGLYERG